MEESRIRLVDLLNERGWVDRWGFMFFAGVGSAGIIAAKVFSAHPVMVAAAAAMAMVLYAWIMDRAGTARVRPDQAGDNCYYLGLIYTLVSLAYAIFFFDPADTAATIVQGFGIALATTIMGLILRVFLNQTRVDIVETEENARLELARAAGDLKSQLSQVVREMSDFSHQTMQSVSEMRDSSIRDVSEASVAATDAIKQAGRVAAETLGSWENEMTTRMERLSVATDKVVAGLDRQTQSAVSIAELNAEFVTRFGSMGDTVRATQAVAVQLVDQFEQLRTLQGGQEAVSRSLLEGSRALQEALAAFETVATRFDQSVSERLGQIERAPVEGLREAGTAIRETVEQVRSELNRLVQLQNTAAENLASQSATALETAERHNAALEAELSKSRANVEKVHDALVDMTRELVRDVEGPPTE